MIVYLFIQLLYIHLFIYPVQVLCLTKAEDCEGSYVALVVRDKDFDEGNIENHSLHQLPHEGHQKQVHE